MGKTAPTVSDDQPEKQRHGRGQVFFTDGIILAGTVDISRDDKVLSIRHGNSTSTYPMSLVQEVKWKPQP